MSAGSPSTPSSKRVFLTGGTGLLGRRVAALLIAQGASVTMLVRPSRDPEDHLGSLRGIAQTVTGDAWNPASLRGRGRGHDVAIHLIGSVKTDPRRGLTFKQLNQTPAHNIAQMAMGDGIPHVILLSAAVAPFGVAKGYMDSKRSSEDDLKQIGVAWTIIRAPALYIPGQRRHSVYRLISMLSYIPLVGFVGAPYRPISIELAAHGIASLALSAAPNMKRMIGPRQLRRAGRILEKQMARAGKAMPEASPEIPDPEDFDEPPFGWTPGRTNR